MGETLRFSFSVLSGILTILGYIPYLRAIVRKETQPVLTTWVIWATLDTIALAAMIVKDTTNGSIISAAVGSWVVVALTLKYGVIRWAWVDGVCFVGALFGIGLIFGSPRWALQVTLASILVSAVPTFFSTWQDPNRENKAAWIIYFFACVVAVLSIRKWTMEDAAQPIVFLVVSLVMLVLLLIVPFIFSFLERRRSLKEARHTAFFD